MVGFRGEGRPRKICDEQAKVHLPSLRLLLLESIVNRYCWNANPLRKGVVEYFRGLFIQAAVEEGFTVREIGELLGFSKRQLYYAKKRISNKDSAQKSVKALRREFKEASRNANYEDRTTQTGSEAEVGE